MAQPQTYDVIVVGSGNAGFSAASSAIDAGATRVLLVEKAPSAWKGGNTTFTAGAYRTVFHGLADVLPLVENAAGLEHLIDMSAYTAADFTADIERVTGGRADAQLAEVLVSQSRATTQWLRDNGVRFRLSFERQAYEIEGRQKFWGGMVLAVVGGGKGLTEQHEANARRKGVEVRYGARVVGLVSEDGAVVGVRVEGEGAEGEGKRRRYEVRARGGVVLCAGGFEASPSLRVKHLGPGWENAYVRGTPYNTGDLLDLAVEAGAATAGHWEGCHSTCWDADAPRDAGDQQLTNQFTKSGYPLGLMLNTAGVRFVDEGVDLRNYTYAKFGREILQQPDAVCFQVWDTEGVKWLRKEEYADEVTNKTTADSVEALAGKLASRGLKRPDRFAATIHEYNTAVDAFTIENSDAKFDPSIKDGLSTRSSKGGLILNKTNWARPIRNPPFVAVKVACGVTFTFGGLKADPESAAVIRSDASSPGDLAGSKSIDGLYCAGEMLGGLFWGNYPGGSGLTAGAVFGRIAGRSAALRALSRDQGKSQNLSVATREQSTSVSVCGRREGRL